MVDFEFPEIPQWIHTKNILENGKIGEILSVELYWNFLSYDLANNIKSWKTDIEQGKSIIVMMGDLKELRHRIEVLERSL